MTTHPLTTARRRGFTAAELSAVAAIIAILALIVIPIFRDRVDEAKRVGTLDDMQGLAKALLLVQADTGHYVRLNDLDNPARVLNEPQAQKDEVPFATSIRPFLNDAERQTFSNNWKGPYAAIQRYLQFQANASDDTAAINPAYFASNNGPITVYEPFIAFNGTGPGVGSYADYENDRFPVDYYGSPYLFFPPSANRPPAGILGTNTESEWGVSVLYSLGPDALPGDGNAIATTNDATTNNLFPEAGILGSGDDLRYTF